MGKEPTAESAFARLLWGYTGAEPEPDTDNLGLLHGLKVMERTSWGLSDTVVLRGPASVDEDGRPTGPDELEIKISSPTRMGLGEWFKDEELYTLEFGPQSEEPVVVQQMNGPIVIPAMTVVERTLWGLSMTCRLRVDAGKGKNIEVKLSLPWPEDRFLKEGQLYSVIFEPVKGEKSEEVEPGEDEFERPPDPEGDGQPYRQERLTSQHLDEALRATYDAVQVPDFDGLKTVLKRAYIGGGTWEASTPYGPSFWERRKEALARQDRINKTAEELLLRPRNVSLTVIEELTRLQDAAGSPEDDLEMIRPRPVGFLQWLQAHPEALEDDDANDN